MNKIKIFISSPQTEFASERLNLFRYLQSDPLLGSFFDPFIFENLPAIDQKIDVAYIKEVSVSDIYIGLFGSGYGYEDPEGISPTEREYVEATKLHKTRLIYIKGAATLKRNPKMATLIKKVGHNVIHKRFNSESELIAGVYASLINYLKEKELIRTGPFDAAPCTDNFENIDENKISVFLSRAKVVRNFPLSPSATTKEILTHLNLLTDNKLTNAAILLFGKTPQRFILSSEVKCAHFHGKEVAKPIPSYHVYKGDVFELVDQCVDFVLSKIDFEVGTREFSNQVPTKYEIPGAVVSEAIVNSIAHRNYGSNGSVQVMLFSDRLEVWNPGTLPSSLSIAQLREPHGSIPFNPLVAESMYLTGYIERFGSGTRDMYRLCKDAGLREPEFRLTDGFTVVVWRPIKDAGLVNTEVTAQATRHATRHATRQVNIEIGEAAKRVILVLFGEMKRVEIQEILGLKDRENFVSNYLTPALESEFIEMTIPETPKHQEQRYRLTVKGIALKKKLIKSQKR